MTERASPKTTPLSEEELGAIRERVAVAISGPWTVAKGIQAAAVENTALTATSKVLHEDVPRLLTLVERLQREIADIQAYFAGDPLALVETLRKERDEEKQRADSNFDGYDRIKDKYSAAVNELKQVRHVSVELHTDLERVRALLGDTLLDGGLHRDLSATIRAELHGGGGE